MRNEEAVRPRRRPAARIAAAVAVALVLGAGACGDGEDRPGQVTSESGTHTGSGSASGSVSGTHSGSGSVSGTGVTAGSLGYGPVSSVDAHAAIGQDAAAIRDELAKAKTGGTVDWAKVEQVFSEGGASKKGDGSTRTLATLVEAPDVVESITHAIEGTGPSAGASDGVRAQRVDKGITVLLARKVIDELEGAHDKVADGNTDPASGAPHDVDEAWAFLTAEGQGPVTTAEKRAADFGKEGQVVEPIAEALKEAQQAALDGDEAALEAATAEVQEGLDYVFYLATYKYLAAEDEAGRAEGAAFYQGIQPGVAAAAPDADAAIRAAFESGDAAAGRAALHRDEVLAALSVDAGERVDG